ncbi:MAG: stage II sporulation protein P [Clostridia bacterium]
MKNFRKINIFRTIDMRKFPLYLLSAVVFFILICFLKTLSFDKITANMASIILKTGLHEPFSVSEEDMVLSIFNVSAPLLEVFNEETAKEATSALPDAEEISTEPPVIFENTAQNVTYSSAEEKGYKSVEGIYINNQTKKDIDVSSLLNKNLDLSLSDSPSVLIVHTHTSESYTPSALYNYTPTETDRTTNLNFNMVSVGEIIYQKLTDNGINVIHDKSINDHPSYSGSYSKSLKLIKSYTEKYPSIKIVIDVHRDAIVTNEGVKMRPVTAFDSGSSQVMLVIGTNESGLDHPAWQTNLAFALKLQHKMNTLYPSLARPINLRKERFNQHTAPYAFILEVGTNGNTLEEAKKGAEYFSEALIALLKE